MVMTVKNPQINFQGQYEKMEFKQVPGTEYPKALYDMPGGKLLGIVNNLKEEHDLLEASGVDHNVPDPLAAAQAEAAELRARLAKYEGMGAAKPVAPAPAVVTAPKAPNPLLQGQAKPMVQPAPGVVIPKPAGT